MYICIHHDFLSQRVTARCPAKPEPPTIPSDVPGTANTDLLKLLGESGEATSDIRIQIQAEEGKEDAIFHGHRAILGSSCRLLARLLGEGQLFGKKEQKKRRNKKESRLAAKKEE